MFYVYLLERLDAKVYYLGYTADLKRRVKEHNGDYGSKTTKAYQWKLIYYEAYLTEKLAKDRERQLKRNRGSKRALYNRLEIDFK